MGRVNPCANDRTLDEAMRQEAELQRIEGAFWKKIRDSQRTKVYRAEDEAVTSLSKRPSVFESMHSVEKFITRVRRSNLVNSFGEDLRFEEIFVERRHPRVLTAVCCSYSNFSILCLPDNPWGRSQNIVVHELAHHFSKNSYGIEGPHGPLFVDRLIQLSGAFISAELADAFRNSFEKGGVKMNSELG